MIGYVIRYDRDHPNTRMAELAMALMADGWRLSGAVQTNVTGSSGNKCDVELAILGHIGQPVRISQSLGAESRGCRLDPDGLETAVAHVARTLSVKTDLLIVNKFGKQEALSRGFCAVIADAMAENIPVLLTVANDYLAEFLEFAGDFAEPCDWHNAESWARGARAAAA